MKTPNCHHHLFSFSILFSAFFSCLHLYRGPWNPLKFYQTEMDTCEESFQTQNTQEVENIFHLLKFFIFS